MNGYTAATGPGLCPVQRERAKAIACGVRRRSAGEPVAQDHGKVGTGDDAVTIEVVLRGVPGPEQHGKVGPIDEAVVVEVTGNALAILDDDAEVEIEAGD